MTYGKIDSQGQIMTMPNPITITLTSTSQPKWNDTIANPTEAQKALVAELDNFLECVYTEPPQYDPTTHYLTQYWQEEDGKAVQHWEVHEIEPTESQ